MIAINGTPINELDPQSEIVKHIKAAQKTIRGDRKDWKLAWMRHLITKPNFNASERGIEEHPAGIWMMAQQRYLFEGNEYFISYYNSTRLDKKGATIFQPRGVDFNGSIVYKTEENLDLIFFLTCVSPKCEIFPSIKKYQNMIRSEKLYFVVDRAAEAKAHAILERAALRVSNYLFGGETSDADIREMAIKLSIPNAGKEDMEVDVLRKLIKDKVVVLKEGKYDQNRLNDFIQVIVSKPNPSTLAKIRKGMELDVLKIDQKQKQPVSHYLTNPNTGNDTKVGEVVEGQDPAITIYEAIKEVNSKLKMLDDYINIAEAKNAPEE